MQCNRTSYIAPVGKPVGPPRLRPAPPPPSMSGLENKSTAAQRKTPTVVMPSKESIVACDAKKICHPGYGRSRSRMPRRQILLSRAISTKRAYLQQFSPQEPANLSLQRGRQIAKKVYRLTTLSGNRIKTRNTTAWFVTWLKIA